MEDKKTVVIPRIQNEINKIDKKENHIYFFVIDTKGNPSGSLEYIYKLANILKKNEYNITMLYQEDEFVGVRDWLGDEYADLPHEDISKENVSVSPSDILFIPELFSNIMTQTKKLPCKRIVILQNYDYILEQMPLSVQWGDLGIMEAITNTDVNAKLVKDIFPYIKTTTIDPYIDSMFGQTNEPKKLIVNIVAKDQRDVNRIIKPFYWKYPTYKWVSFRDLRGFPKETFAKCLRESVITIWADDTTNFGYSALEAMKCGNIVLAKTPQQEQKWMTENDSINLKNCCVWFDSFHDMHKMIASVIRSWTTDNIPPILGEKSQEVLTLYSEENTKAQLLTYIEGVLNSRKMEMESLIQDIENGKE